jgi:hypothetical protein
MRGGVLRIALMDLRRSWRVLGTGSIGLAFTVAALVFFVALALGVRSVLLGRVFPLDSVEVSAGAPSLDILALRLQLGSDTLDREAIESLEALAGVERVFPKMKLTVPAMASGGQSLLGAAMRTELVADGIDEELVRDEVGQGFTFSGVETEVACATDRDCGDGAYCSGRGFGAYGYCRNEVPVLISPHLVELYNGSFRRAYGLPQLNPDRIVGISFEMDFGASSLRPARGRRVISERMRIAGISERAIPLGVTLPIDFVRDLNVSFSSERAADRYHSAILELEDKRDATAVIEAVQAMNLVVRDRGARRASTLLAILLATIGLVGVAMIGIAAVNVAHAFFMIVWSRQRDIGLLRAVGATRGAILRLFGIQAVLVGALSGLAGVLVGVGAIRLADRLARSTIPDFPYKPESFFLTSGWLAVAAVLLAVMACVAGAAIPVWRASSRDPAEVLTIPG